MVNIVAHRVGEARRGSPHTSDTDSEESQLSEVLQNVDPDISHSCFGELLPRNPTGLLPISHKIVKSFGAMKKVKKIDKNDNKQLEEFVSEIAMKKATRFSLKQLNVFTENFRMKLGMGGFGTVFKGMMGNGVQVAVKRLGRAYMEEQFMAEVSVLGLTYHRNIIGLCGYCIEGDVVALVYEYMENGSLRRILSDRDYRIGWDKLYQIAFETAKSISYLHEDCQQVIIHFDIKPANILLDSNFSPRLADFGLAVQHDRDDSDGIDINVRGTLGYLDPNFCITGFGTCKCDVYSFGMVLFDILERKGNLRHSMPVRFDEDWFPRQVWDEFEKGNLKYFLGLHGIQEIHRDQACRLSMAALWCVQYKPEDRPFMSTVVSILKGDCDAIPPNPFVELSNYAPYSSDSFRSDSTLTVENRENSKQSIPLEECDRESFTSIMGKLEIEIASPTKLTVHERPISLNGTTSTSRIEYNARAQGTTHHPIRAFPSEYIKSFPSKFIPYIQYLKDFKGDGNCGFRAVADLLGITENGWASVREDLIYELQLHWEEYSRLYEQYGSIDRLMNSLEFYDLNAPLDYWMDMPDMGHLIASCYNVVLVHISSKQCLTFLPLRSQPLQADLHQIISVGFVNGNHFVALDLEQGCPIPPIAERWHRHCHTRAKEWEQPYTSRIEHFEELVRGENVALRETPTEVTGLENVDVNMPPINKEQDTSIRQLTKEGTKQYVKDKVEGERGAAEEQVERKLNTITSSPLWHLVAAKDQPLVNKFFDEATPMTCAFTKLEGKCVIVYATMVTDLLWGKAIDAQVINWFMYVVLENDQRVEKNTCVFISALFKTMYDINADDAYHRSLVAPLMDDVHGDPRYIFMPLCKNQHWTLLVCDFNKDEFIHYNSLTPESENVEDPCRNHAATMRWTMEKAIITVRGYRGNIHKYFFKHALQEGKCPQQGSTRNSGLIVCKIMEWLSKGEAFNYNQDEVIDETTRMRASFTSSLLSHCPYSCDNHENS